MDWNFPYYHRGDSIGIGFNRTQTGSDAVDQYFAPVANKFNPLSTCPTRLLLWFYHGPSMYRMKSGKTLWDDLCYRRYEGVTGVTKTQTLWNSLRGKTNQERSDSEKLLPEMQCRDAIRWRNDCLLYFQAFSKLPIPSDLPKPDHDLQYYEKHNPW